MRVEQACRFATKESGYRISAKSTGFEATSGENLGYTFNQTMNGLFPRLGKSLVSLSICNQDVFLAKVTLRSDISNRASLFTNALVIPLTEYRHMMRTSPQAVLEYPMQNFLTSQPYAETMETIDLDMSVPAKITPIDVIKKYQLSQADLAAFYEGIYGAYFSQGSLCITTNRSFEESIELARDFSILAVDGLLPSMRETYTFSSGGDTRNLVCVRTSEMGGVLSAGGVDVYEFSADLESRDSLPIDENLEVNSIEDMLRIFCQDLASHDEEDRQTMLTFLEGAIREFDKVNGIHEPCILLAFYYAYIQREEDVYEAAIFIDSFLQYMDAVPQGQVDIELVNDQIVHWMSILVDHKICLSEKISSHLIDWVLDEGDEGAQGSLAAMLTLGKPEMKLSLATKLLEKTYSEAIGDLVSTLLNENSVEWSPQFTDCLFKWTCEHNITSLCSVVWAHKKESSYILFRTLLDENLLQIKKEGQPLPGESIFNDCEMKYLALCLKDLMDHPEEGQKELLSHEEIKVINDEYQNLSPDLQSMWIAYTNNFYLASLGSVKAQTSYLRSLDEDEKGKVIFAEIDHSARERQDSAKINIIENYEVERTFEGAESCQELVERSRRENNFSPQGPFEPTMLKLWKGFMESDFKEIKEGQYDADDRLVKEDKDCLMEIVNCYENKYLRMIDDCQVSKATKHKLNNHACYDFWSQIQYAWILSDLEFISSFMERVPKVILQKRFDDFDVQEIEKKFIVAEYAGRLLVPEESETAVLFLERVIRKGEWSVEDFLEDFPGAEDKLEFEKNRILHYDEEERDEMREALKTTADEVRNSSKKVPLDLLLLSSWSVEDEDFDLEDFTHVYVAKYDNRVFSVTDDEADVDQSILLTGPKCIKGLQDDLRKVLEKSLDRDPYGVLSELEEQLRDRRGGSNFFGGLTSRLFRKKG